MAVAVVVSGVAAPLATVRAGPDCRDEPRELFRFSDPRVSRLLSNLRSDWAEGGTTITYNETKTAEVNASMTASVSAEAGVIFAKASASVGATVGASWQKAGSWSFTRTVPAGKEGRLVMYRESRAFTVVKRVLNRKDCTYRTDYSAPTNAPVKSGSNVWRLQLRKRGSNALPGAEPGSNALPGAEGIEEVDVAVEKDVEGEIAK